MPTILHIDGEVPGCGEFDLVQQSGASTISQGPAFACGHRGASGFNCRVAGTSAAYAQANLESSQSPAPDQWLCVGFWARFRAVVMGRPVGLCATGDNYDLSLMSFLNGMISISTARDDGTYANSAFVLSPIVGRWHYIVAALRRSSAQGVADGMARLYLDGKVLVELTALGNYQRWAAINNIRVGCWANASDGLDWDFDELKIAVGSQVYIEPSVTSPADECPGPERTIVLAADTADGRAFADDCIAAGTPAPWVCYLPHATATETLADYAAWQSQVQQALLDWLARHPVAANQATTLLLGPGLPGGFMHEGRRISATSRLMNVLSPLGQPTPNGLYRSAGDFHARRLTVSDLHNAGLMLATRVDAASTADARALLQRGTQLAGAAIDAGEMLLLTSQADRMSLSAGMTRLAITDECSDQNVCLAGGTLASQPLGQAGSRAAVIETAAVAQTLRSPGSPAAWALLQGGYAAALAPAADAVPNIQAALDMLRISGTWAEAAAVALPTLDDEALAAGWANLTLALPKAGVNVYHGLGHRQAVNFQTPVAAAAAPAADSPVTLDTPLDLSDGLDHVLVVRSVSAAGIEETQGTEVVARTPS